MIHWLLSQIIGIVTTRTPMSAAVSTDVSIRKIVICLPVRPGKNCCMICNFLKNLFYKRTVSLFCAKYFFIFENTKVFNVV